MAYTSDGVSYYTWRWALLWRGVLFAVENGAINKNHVTLLECSNIRSFDQLVKRNFKEQILRNKESGAIT